MANPGIRQAITAAVVRQASFLAFGTRNTVRQAVRQCRAYIQSMSDSVRDSRDLSQLSPYTEHQHCLKWDAQNSGSVELRKIK